MNAGLNDETMGADTMSSTPGRPQDSAAEYREKLLETIVEQDEEVMESYLEGEEPDEAIKRLIRRLCRDFFQSSWFRLQEQGVQTLLDVVVDYRRPSTFRP